MSTALCSHLLVKLTSVVPPQGRGDWDGFRQSLWSLGGDRGEPSESTPLNKSESKCKIFKHVENCIHLQIVYLICM